jgi:hypothetical protein
MSLAPGPVCGALTTVCESGDSKARAIDAVYDTERKASERKPQIAFIERFANIR